jgi:hypothetical protein
MPNSRVTHKSTQPKPKLSGYLGLSDAESWIHNFNTGGALPWFDSLWMLSITWAKW